MIPPLGEIPFLNPVVPVPEMPLPRLDLIPPEIPAVELPLTRQPFDKNWPIHYMGKMEVPCIDCGALH